MTDELKPCPFCGGEARYLPAYGVRCWSDACAAKIPCSLENAAAAWNTRPEPSVQEAADFDRQDWYWRDMDPDDSGDNPHEALRYLPDLCVAMIRSSTTGPTRYAFRATVLDPDSDDTEVLHFSTEEEALKAREDRAAALRAAAEKGGE